jgi:hypothetical protein
VGTGSLIAFLSSVCVNNELKWWDARVQEKVYWKWASRALWVRERGRLGPCVFVGKRDRTGSVCGGTHQPRLAVSLLTDVTVGVNGCASFSTYVGWSFYYVCRLRNALLPW